jgi:hypothetical protein
MRLPSGLDPPWRQAENDAWRGCVGRAAAWDRVRLAYTLRPSGAHAPMVGTTLIGYHVSS